VISFPAYFEPGAIDPLGQLAAQLGVATAAPVTSDFVTSMLQQIAYETPAARRAGVGVVTELVQAITEQPVVITEQSAPSGRSLSALMGQAAPAYILVAEGKPFLALAVEAGLIVVWFIAGPVQGAREGLRQAAYDATKTVATEQLERWLRRRFPGSRGGRKR
jgi:hypothetical protein